MDKNQDVRNSAGEALVQIDSDKTVDFLIQLLNKFKEKSKSKWITFINKSQQIWVNHKEWKNVREEIIRLEKGVLSD